MVNYVCYRCGYTTNHKSKMNVHLSRKKPCNVINTDINLDECKKYILQGYTYSQYLKFFKKVSNGFKPDGMGFKPDGISENNSIIPENNSIVPENNSKIPENNSKKFKCKYCERCYTRKDNLTKHYKTCKEKKEDETVKQSMSDLVKLLNEKDKYFKEELDKRDKELHKRDKEFKMELKEKDNQYKSQIDELIKKAGIQNSTITQNIQNNIKLLNYGNTDISHLTDQDFIGCLKHKNFCIPYLIEKIHFDKDKPENHNIYISNLKNKYVMMFEKKKWETKNRDDTIDKLICDKEGIMEEKLGEWEENGGQYADLRNRYDIYVEKRNIKDVFDQIKDDIELMLYNNKDMISKK